MEEKTIEVMNKVREMCKEAGIEYFFATEEVAYSCSVEKDSKLRRVTEYASEIM